jgi:hypothetical protein
MSQQPPPPPYGGPPGNYPPGNYPPGNHPPGYPAQDPAQPNGMSNKAKFWIGVALTIPVVVICSLNSGASSALVESVTGDSSAGGAVASAVSLGQFALFIVALVLERTRWFALGVLAGAGILLILAAGACVVLIFGLSQGFS